MSNAYDIIAEYARLNNELDELSRPVDEEIMVFQIEIKKLQEKKKEAFGLLMKTIADLAEQGKHEVGLLGESTKVGGWNFVVSNTMKVDQKQLKADAESNESLRKYLSEAATVSIRKA